MELFTQTYGAISDSFDCKVEGNVISSKKVFAKSDCFNIYDVIIYKNNSLQNFQSIEKLNDSCVSKNIQGGYGIENISQLSPYQIFEPNREYYFQSMYGAELFINGEKTFFSSIIKKIYTEKTSNFDSLPECPGYPLGEEKTQTGSIQQINTVSQSEPSQKMFSGIQEIIIGVILGCLVCLMVNKFLFRKK